MKDKQLVIACSFGAILAFWTVDAAIDAFAFRRGTFMHLLLFDVSLQELYSRMVIIAGLALYGIFIMKVRDVTERRKLDEETQKHNEQLEDKVRERTERLHVVNDLLHKEILERRRAEEELSRSESFLNTIFDSVHDPFSIVDTDFKIIKFNDAYSRIKKMRPEELAGEKCYETLYQRSGVCGECIVEKTFQSGDPCAKEKLITAPGEPDAWIEIYTYPILDRDGQVSHVIQYARDITDRKKAEEEMASLIRKLNRLSTTDGLTGLLNRRALTDTLRREIERAQRYESGLSVMLCDIDEFKSINDEYGHATGDEALRVVAAALTDTVRKADIAGRYGGDEFMVILPETSLPGAENLAEKIRSAVAGLEIAASGKGQERFRLSLSIGVAGCCSAVDDLDTLVKAADSALYTAKHLGKNRVSAEAL